MTREMKVAISRRAGYVVPGRAGKMELSLCRSATRVYSQDVVYSPVQSFEVMRYIRRRYYQFGNCDIYLSVYSLLSITLRVFDIGHRISWYIIILHPLT